MNNFVYYAPTKVIFGKGVIGELANECKCNGYKRVLIIYGSQRIEENGLLDSIEEILDKENIRHMRFSGVKANPIVQHAEVGVNVAKEFEADLLLAIGGGSCIDTAKAISVGVYNNEGLWNIWCGEGQVEKTMPIACVLTIPAAGSEMSNSAVLTNSETKQKRGLNCEMYRCKFAIMDPTYCMSLPKKQIACGVTDIMMHTLERFFYSKELQQNEMTDAIAVALLKVVIKYGKRAYDNEEDYEAMSEIMWASSLSHNDITGLGGIKDFSVHQFGHELSAMFDISHGESLSAVWGTWARFVMDKDIARFSKIANMVWDIPGEDKQTALKGIAAFEACFKDLGMPISIGELSCGVLGKDTLAKLTNSCTRGGSRAIGAFCPLSEKEVFEVYSLANF